MFFFSSWFCALTGFLSMRGHLRLYSSRCLTVQECLIWYTHMAGNGVDCWLWSQSFQPEAFWFSSRWHLHLVWTMIGWHLVSKRKEVEAASLFKAFIQQYQNITFPLFYWSKPVKSSQDSRGEKLKSICWCVVQQEHRERREIVRYHVYKVATISSFVEDRGCIDGFVWFSKEGDRNISTLL